MDQIKIFDKYQKKALLQNLGGSDDIYEKLKAKGVDVLIDDRGESAGIKFKDAELTGIPVRVTIGPRTLEKGEVELKTRMDGESRNIKIEDITVEVEKLLV